MRAALVLAHFAVQLGDVDPATVFEVASEATDGPTTGNLVAVARHLAVLLAALFREGNSEADAVAAFEAVVAPLALQIVPPTGAEA